MEEINWLHVVIALVSGGAMGATINAIVSAFRARVQPVGRRIEILPIFRAASGDTLRANVSITFRGLGSIHLTTALIDSRTTGLSAVAAS